MTKHTDEQTEKTRRLLDAQAQELELRFNQFLKELEEDYNFTASSSAAGDDPLSSELTKGAPRLRTTRLDERLTNIEQHYAEVDRKYTVMLWVTGALTVLIFVYLGYVLFR
ncbi:MAG: hypothetical protein ACU837_08640 [Gammaproteobacteria bacterium]